MIRRLQIKGAFFPVMSRRRARGVRGQRRGEKVALYLLSSPLGHLSQSQGTTHPKAHGPVGLPILCRDSSAAHAWTLASRAQSHRHAGTPSPTARATLWGTLFI